MSASKLSYGSLTKILRERDFNDPLIYRNLQNIFGAIDSAQRKITQIVNENVLDFGATTARPTIVRVGTEFFDQTLGKPIWVKSIGPTVWVDATGATV